MGLSLDLSGFGMGVRSNRYAAVIDNGVVSRTRYSVCTGLEGMWSPARAVHQHTCDGYLACTVKRIMLASSARSSVQPFNQ